MIYENSFNAKSIYLDFKGLMCVVDSGFGVIFLAKF